MSVNCVTAGGAASGTEFSASYRIYALILLTAVYVSNYADRMILSVLVPAIKAEFGLSDAAMGFLSGTAFAIFYATLGVPIAMWADRGNRKTIIVLATALWSIMTALCGLAGNFWQLAVTRIGVGVGEAGGSPPSHSIISDMFPPRTRVTALAVFTMGAPLGLLIGLYGGAQVAEAYGWRAAFYALGIPGLAIALLVWLTLREPTRGAIEGYSDTVSAPPLIDVVKHILSQRSLVHAFAGATLTTLVGYAGVVWWPSFIVRSHGLSMADMTLFLALVFGIAGAGGVFAGGYFANLMSQRDLRWMPRVVAAAIAIGLPFAAATYLVDSSVIVFVLIGVPAFVGGVYLPPTYAMTQGLVGVRMRTVASALLLFSINFVGMSVGPLLTGYLSDLWMPDFGEDSLRYALLAVTAFNVWAAAHYWIAGRYFEGDLKRMSGTAGG